MSSPALEECLSDPRIRCVASRSAASKLSEARIDLHLSSVSEQYITKYIAHETCPFSFTVLIVYVSATLFEIYNAYFRRWDEGTPSGLTYRQEGLASTKGYIFGRSQFFVVTLNVQA